MMSDHSNELTENKDFLLLLLAAGSALIAGIGFLGVVSAIGSLVSGGNAVALLFGLIFGAVLAGGVWLCRYAFRRKFELLGLNTDGTAKRELVAEESNA